MDETRLAATIRAIVAEELARARAEARPASVEFAENAKGERTVAVKEYGRDAAEALAGALATFRLAVRQKKIVGTEADPEA